MTDPEKPILPAEAQEILNDIASQNKGSGKKKVFVGVPNMGEINVSLWLVLFSWANNNQEYEMYYHFVVEKHHADFARNILVSEFLKTDCEYMVQIDADVSPRIDLLSLIKHDKDIISGNTHCWMGDKLIPSIWQRAECEQCVNLKKWMEEGIVHDPREYFAEKGLLYRWEPINQRWQNFANRNGILGGMKCRCQGTGFDPWVYKMFQKAFEPGKIVRVDSVGSASLIIRRNVVEAIKPPHFMFLYKPSREILLTEDHYFCWVAGLSGFEVWADLDMICSHYKRVDLAAVNARMVQTFNAGMDYQSKNSGIIMPTEADLKMVMESKTEEKKLVLA